MPLSPPLFAAEPNKMIVGYFAGWAKHYTAADIPADKLTHVNYAFAVIRDGKCTVTDIAKAEKHFAQLRALKLKHPHLRTLISVGGWTDSGPFSDTALTAESRANFARSCLEFIHKHGFDGVDIDWEFPVSGGFEKGRARPQDTVNFTALLRELRDRLNTHDKTCLLTIAAPASKGHASHIQLREITPMLDFINLMTYDFAGPWSKTTSFNAPLFGDASADSAVKLYLETGVPAEKINLGVPFYGRAWGGVKNINHGLDQPHDHKWPEAAGSGKEWSYWDIEKNYLNQPSVTRYWHEQAKVPWLYDATKQLMVSYDDPQSLKLKAEYARDHNLGGVMIWELSQDDHQSSLLNALNAGLRGESNPTKTAK